MEEKTKTPESKTKTALPLTFSFGDGRSVRLSAKPDEIPRLPPRAVKAVLDVYEAHGVDPTQGVGDLDDPKNMPFFIEMATVAVALTLKRLERSLTIEDLMDDADLDLILTAFPRIVPRNPTLFGGKDGGKKAVPRPEESADPTSATSE